MVRTSRGFRPTYVEPAVTADIKTNSGNVCEYWDASCKIQQGLDSINVGVIQAGEDITSWGETTTQWVQGGFVEAGENIQDAYVKNVETPILQGVENIQDAYVENIETPIVKGVEYVQGGIDEQIKAAQDAAAIIAKNTQDAFNATIKAAQDAADKAAQDAQDAFNATIKAAQDAADAVQDAADKAAQDAQDAFNATIKAAQDAADAAAKAAADAAAAAGKGVVKPVTDMMMMGGVAALGIGLLLVMKK